MSEFSEYELGIEAAIQIAIEQRPIHLILRDRRRLVSATSSWNEAKGMQVWILQWLNEEQLSRQRSPSHKSKGGEDLTVKVTSDDSVKYSMAR